MRLHVLLSAGGARLAIPAERVRRVHAGTDRGLLLAEALGLPPRAPGAAIEVEALAEPLLVDALPAVVETSGSAPVRLPAASRTARSIFDRALLLGGEVHLEFEPGRLRATKEPEAGPTGGPGPALPPPGPLAVPETALAFPAGERRFAVPFDLVLGILEAPRLFPVPGAPAAHRGVTLHAGALVAVLDLPAALGQEAGPEGRFAVLVDAGAGPVGLVATGPGQVVADLRASGAEAEEGGIWLVDPAGGRLLLPRLEALPGARGPG